MAETPSEQAMKRAREIVAAFGDGLPPFDCGHGACNNCDESLGQLEYAITEAIAAALRAIDIPEGFLRTSDGVDRKVLGTLPISGDDCVVGFPPGYGGLFRVPHEYGGGERIEQCNPMHMSYDQASRCIMVRGGGWSGLSEHPVGGCYSSPQAARAAESARTHKETGNG